MSSDALEDLRPGFREATRGWARIATYAAITERIEAAGKFVDENGGCAKMTAGESRLLGAMIEYQFIHRVVEAKNDDPQ